MASVIYRNDTLVMVVVNDGLVFIRVDRHQRGHVVYEMSLEAALATGDAPATLPEALNGARSDLLILPDYWVQAAAYPFQSRKRSLAAAFIARKLITEHPEFPDIVNFFDFDFSAAGLEERTVRVSFIQDGRAFELFRRLSVLRLAPPRILTPALIWEQKLLTSISEFDIGGTCLVHLLAGECFLYFFFQGRFLFSRRIVLPEARPRTIGESSAMAMETEAPATFSVLTFEINQSLYLFAQKTKADMGRIHLAADDPGDAERLSLELGREVTHYRPGGGGTGKPSSGLTMPESLGPISAFSGADLAPSALQMNLTHARLRQMIEWRPVQRTAMIAGTLLILLMAAEGLFLWEKAGVNREHMSRVRSMSATTQQQIIQDYGQVLDMLLAETDRPSPRAVIVNVGRALPQNAWITGIDIRNEAGPGVLITGIIRADTVAVLQETLSGMLKQLNRYFQGSQALNLEDINFSLEKQGGGQNEQTYTFNLEFDLP